MMAKIVAVLLKAVGKVTGVLAIAVALLIAIVLEVVHWRHPGLTDRSFFLRYWQWSLLCPALLFGGICLWCFADVADAIPDAAAERRREHIRQAANRARVERIEKGAK